MTGISKVPRNPILVSEGLCLFWYTGFNGIPSDPWKNVSRIHPKHNSKQWEITTYVNFKWAELRWRRSRVQPSVINFMFENVSRQWETSSASSLHPEIWRSVRFCHLLASELIPSDKCYIMESALTLLGLQSFQKAESMRWLRTIYRIPHRSCKQEGMGLRRRTVVCVCVCVFAHMWHTVCCTNESLCW